MAEWLRWQTRSACLPPTAQGFKNKNPMPLGKYSPGKWILSQCTLTDSDLVSFQSENGHTEKALFSSDSGWVTESKCGELVTAHSGYSFEIIQSFMTSA